jgi:hypothetical protein
MSANEIDPPIAAGNSKECAEDNSAAPAEVKTLTALASGFTTQKATQRGSEK